MAPEWGWAWPMNRRILYNRASADPDGQPWSERKRYLWWDARGRASGPARTCPTSSPTRRPTTSRPRTPQGPDALRGDEPFIMQADGKAWLYAPAGLVDGPLPTHYEPHESPFGNPLYASQQSNPARQQIRAPGEPLQPHSRRAGRRRLPLRGDDLPAHRAPHRGRDVALAAPPGRAAARDVLRGLAGARARARPRARRVDDDRHAARGHRGARAGHRPDDAADDRARQLHQVGLPYHWGSRGIAKGDSANDLLGLALDPNVHIGEYKAQTCDVRAGRRPRGPALLALLEDYRRRAAEAGVSEPPAREERP